MTGRPAVIGSLMLAFLAGGGVSAQDRVLLRGRVVDGTTRAPIEGAFVTPLGLPQGVLTDSLGRFILESEPESDYPLSVERLGYATLMVTLASTAPVEFSTLLLRPNPIALEGLTVLVDRFERRRRRYSGSVRVVDEQQLLRSARISAYEVIRSQIPAGRPCMDGFEDLCFWRRGQIRRAEICIDDRPAWSGARELEAYDPRELYLIEVYGWGQRVRVYTRWYVDDMLRRGRSLRPLSFGC